MLIVATIQVVLVVVSCCFSLKKNFNPLLLHRYTSALLRLRALESWTSPSSQPSLMGELWLAYETSWQQSKNNCITAPECLGRGWLPLMALPAAQAKCPQQTLNLAIPDLLSIHWQDHRHHLLSCDCLRPSLRPYRHYHTCENVQYVSNSLFVFFCFFSLC